MQLICERGRQAAAEVAEEFSKMYDMLQEQPKDIEKLTEISEFIETVVQKSEELQVGIDSMTEHYECLEGLQFETPQEDFTARWESFHWPLRLKLKQEECNKMLEEDRVLFQKEMNSQQQQFDRQVEELAERVADFHKHTDLSRITKVVGMVKDIEKSLKDYEEKAKVFNARSSSLARVRQSTISSRRSSRTLSRTRTCGLSRQTGSSGRRNGWMGRCSRSIRTRSISRSRRRRARWRRR